MVFVPQRVKILKFVAEQGVVTVDDLARHLLKTNQIPAIRTGLHDCGLAHTKYGDIKQGLWYIKNPKLFSEIKQFYFPYLPNFTVQRLKFGLVEHALELNRIRTTLEQTDQMVIQCWWSEGYIRALPSWVGTQGLATRKVPDAIFWRQRSDGSQQIFYLEYERYFKNKDRYKEIFRFYSKRPDVKARNVIFLCQDPSLKYKLEELEARFAKTGDLQDAGLFFQFIALDDFYRTYTNKKQEGKNGQQTKTLSQQTYA